MPTAADVLKLIASSPSGAVFSEDRRHRYLLWRRILQADLLMPDRGICLFSMLNPSKADEKKPDPTVTRTINFATLWGFSTLLVTNMYGWRSTDKDVLVGLPDPVGPDNDAWISAAAAAADLVVGGWGDGPVKLDLVERARQVVAAIGRPMVCLSVNESGHPQHPLYIAGDTVPIPYSAERLAG